MWFLCTLSYVGMVCVICNCMAYSPLEQFAILRLIPVSIGSLDLGFTNSAFITAIGIILLVVSFRYGMKNYSGNTIPKGMQTGYESLYTFLLSMVKEQIGAAGTPYFPLVFAVFTFLLVLNLLGMIPYSFTATSHFVVTLGFAVSLFIGATLLGFSIHGLHYLALLLPSGAPLQLAPFLVLLEAISYFFKAISLGVRLGANMLAGHCLLKIIAGFGWTMLGVGGWLSIAAFGPIGVVVILTGLELGIAMIQAYVFAMLFAIYLNDAIHLH